MLPFENLTADPSLDWIGGATSRIVVERASASVNTAPFYVPDLRTARLGHARRAIEGYYSRSPGGQIAVMAVVRDLDSNQNERSIKTTSGTANVVTVAAEAIAKGIDTRTRRFGTENAEAIQAWAAAGAAGDRERKTELLERAIAADPNFGQAYVELAQLYVATGDQPRALEVAKRASDRMGQFTDLERARFELVESGLRGDEVQRRQALTALTRLVSTDVQNITALAGLELNARRYDTAIDLFRNAVALQPDNPQLLNQLGYAEAYNGRIDAARQTFERYRALDPKGANPIDSLGEAYFINGRFAEAEKCFLEAQAIPGPLSALDWLKAAQSRYMLGDHAKADEYYAKFDGGVRVVDAQTADVRKAQWLYVTGRREAAMASAQSASRGANPEIAAYAKAQLALWVVDGGDRPRGAQLAGQALAGSRNPNVQRVAAMIQSAANGSALNASPTLAQAAQAYGALFAGDFSKAAALWEPIYRQTPPASDGDVRTMYAWALAGAGRKDEARPLVERYFVPLGSADEALLTSQAFPRLIELRTALRGK